MIKKRSKNGRTHKYLLQMGWQLNKLARLLGRTHFGRALVLTFAVALGTAFMPQPASASYTYGDRSTYGNYSFMYADWAANPSYSSYGYHYIQAEQYNLPWGTCTDALFDWERNVWPYNSHHDPRVARSCINNGYRNLTSYDSASGLKGILKGGGCNGGNNTHGTCWSFSPVVDGSPYDINNVPGPCTRLYTLDYDGVNRYYSGGVPTSCSS